MRLCLVSFISQVQIQRVDTWRIGPCHDTPACAFVHSCQHAHAICVCVYMCVFIYLFFLAIVLSLSVSKHADCAEQWACAGWAVLPYRWCSPDTSQAAVQQLRAAAALNPNRVWQSHYLLVLCCLPTAARWNSRPLKWTGGVARRLKRTGAICMAFHFTAQVEGIANRS